MAIEHIIKYFPHLTDEQKRQFAILEAEYPQWNEKINVISRKDIDNLEVNHILHSLAIAKFTDFAKGTRILDFGTGGGFPAIPLAVLLPGCKFHLVDRIAKKLRVAQAVAQAAGLRNITIQHGDIKEVKGKFDFVVSRAVMEMGKMVPLLKRLVDSDNGKNALPNGLICLKGGDLTDELAPFASSVVVDDLNLHFDEPFFETKKIVYMPL